MGVGLSREEAYRIQASIKRLADKKQTLRIRFWGKILAKAGDYLVVEGVPKQQLIELGQDGPDIEKHKEGANYNTYWVTQNSRKYLMIQSALIGFNCH